MSTTTRVNTEDHPAYGSDGKAEHMMALKTAQYKADNDRVDKALDILSRRLTRPDSRKAKAMTCPDDARKYLTLKLAEREHEVFAVMFLDNRHTLIDFQEMFRGTIDTASVHPREVVKDALKVNAAAIIVAHNHPSGDPEPSKNDEDITYRLRDACQLLQIRLLDHVIVGGVETVSLADRGLI